jgi:hypothetical protein
LLSSTRLKADVNVDNGSRPFGKDCGKSIGIEKKSDDSLEKEDK